MKNKNKFYKTKDCLISATLDCLGAKLSSTEWDNGSLYFFFEDYDSCEEIINKYYRGELRVNPKDLFNASKNIKSIIYNN